MPVWDDEARDVGRPAPGLETGVPAPLDHAITHGRAHDAVRAAAQKDAAEIVARARRDIRRIVTDARRELLELSAQVQAANVEPPDAVLPAPSVIEPEEVIPHGDDAWLRLSPELSPSGGEAASVEHDVTFAVASFEVPPASPNSARMFVGLFTLAGSIVVAGTAWWLAHAPPPTSTATPGRGPGAAAAASKAPPAVEAPVAESSTPLQPDKLSIALEARRDTWARTTVDGEPDAGRTYTAGETWHVDGASEVAIRAGDAGGLLVSVDGKPAV